MHIEDFYHLYQNHELLYPFSLEAFAIDDPIKPSPMTSISLH